MPVNVIDTLKPKNNGEFAVVEAVDVAVSSGKRLPAALAEKADASALAETNTAVQSKANASDVETKTANLQAQINSIITPVTQDAEVQNARTNASGTTFTTLKTRLDASDTAVSTKASQTEVTGLKEDLNSLENCEETTIRTAVTGWSLGTLTSTGVIPSTFRAFSKAYSNDDMEIEFDSSKYKLAFALFDTADSTTVKSFGSWITTSPATNDVTSSERRYIRIYIEELSHSEINVSSLNINKIEEKYSPLVEKVLKVENQIGTTSTEISGITSGYYIQGSTAAVGDDWKEYLSENQSSKYITQAVDLSNYIGGTVIISATNILSASTRSFGLCDSNDIIKSISREQNMTYNGSKYETKLKITDDAHFLFFSISAAATASGLSVIAQKDKLEEKIVQIVNENVAADCVFVSTTGSDNNDGSKDSPFATIQRAVNSGAKIIKVYQGTYSEFAVKNRNHPLTIMLADIPSYTPSTVDQDAPKIKITGGTSTPYNGITIENCSEVRMYDVWVDDVPRYPYSIINCMKIECIRCYASNNTTSSFSGFRIVNSNGDFVDCKAWNIMMDGFNIHGYGDTQFINCVAHDCGDDGISHHDSCTGVIIGGEYYKCGKGGVSSPYGGAKIDIHNVYSHTNTRYGIYADSDTNHPKINAKISNCLLKNNGTSDIYIADGTVIGWHNIYDTKDIHTDTATFTEYN